MATLIESALEADNVLFVGGFAPTAEGVYGDHAYTVLGVRTRLPLDTFLRDFPHMVQTVGS